MISIIIPMYNGEKDLKRCFDSIECQTYSDFEVIIVDDGSTDNSAAVAKEYCERDGRFRLIQTENFGASHARNVGLENMKGEYFTFVDCDDSLIDRALEILYNDLLSANADMSVALIAAIDQKGVSLDNFSEDSFVMNNRECALCIIENRAESFSSVAKLYKRETYKHIRFDEKAAVHEDTLYVSECFMASDSVFVRNIPVYHYYLAEGSLSRNISYEKYLSISYATELKKKLILDKYPEFCEKAENLTVKSDMALVEKFVFAQDKKYKQIVKECRKRIRKNKKHFIPNSRRDIFSYYLIVYCFPLYRIIKYIYANKKFYKRNVKQI